MAELEARLKRLSEVNVQTVRFYEREGILPQPGRRPSGYREYYPQETIGLVRIIKHLQRLGFSLKEIKETARAAEAAVGHAGDGPVYFTRYRDGVRWSRMTGVVR